MQSNKNKPHSGFVAHVAVKDALDSRRRIFPAPLFRADFSPSFPPAAPTGRDMTAMHTVATIFYEL
ncbi:MAG: hypothetical protein ACLVJK_03015 [Alistipes putredinis]